MVRVVGLCATSAEKFFLLCVAGLMDYFCGEGSCLRFVFSPMSWHDARDHCHKYNMELIMAMDKIQLMQSIIPHLSQCKHFCHVSLCDKGGQLHQKKNLERCLLMET